MNLVRIYLHERDETVFLNPDQVTHIEPLTDGSGSYTVIHLASGEVLSAKGDPHDVAWALIDSNE